jgi:hypothetical protein
MLRRVVWQKLTDVLTASIIMAMDRPDDEGSVYL